MPDEIGEQTFEAYIHTAEGVIDIDLTDPINCLILGAFRQEKLRRNQLIPDRVIYEIKPYIHTYGIIFVNVLQIDKSDEAERSDMTFVFMEGEEDGVPTLVPEDRVNFSEKKCWLLSGRPKPERHLAYL